MPYAQAYELPLLGAAADAALAIGRRFYGACVPARISSLAISKPWLPFALVLALIAVTAPLWLAAPRDLGVGLLGDEAARLPDLTISLEAGTGVGRRVASVAMQASRSQLESDSAVAGLRSSRRGATPVLELTLAERSPDSRLRALSEIPANIDPGPLTVIVGGSEAQLQAAKGEFGGDLWRIAILALPFALLALSAISGWRWALALLLAAASAIALSAAFVRAIGAIADLSAVALTVAAVLAIAAAVESASMLAFRASDLPAQAGRADRLEAAISEGGRDLAVWAAAAAAVGVLAAFTGFEQSASLTVGVIAGLLGGVLSGGLVAVGGLAGAARPAVHRLAGSISSLVARLAGRSTGWHRPRSRLRRISERAGVLGAGMIVTCAGALVAYLLREQLSKLFGSEPPSGLGTAALVAAIIGSLAVLAGRTALSARIYRESVALGARACDGGVDSFEAGLPGSLAVGVLAVLFGALLLVPRLGAAGEFGALVAALLALDALVVRPLCAAGWARLR